MIVCPGGGWRILAWEHEGIDVANWLAAHGYTAFVLKYRVHGTPATQADYDAEMAKLYSQIDLTRRGRKAPRAMGDIVPYESSVPRATPRPTTGAARSRSFARGRRNGTSTPPRSA